MIGGFNTWLVVFLPGAGFTHAAGFTHEWQDLHMAGIARGICTQDLHMGAGFTHVAGFTHEWQVSHMERVLHMCQVLHLGGCYT